MNLPGKPDFIFKEKSLAIFIDGCFCTDVRFANRLPDDNRPYWRKKVLSNRLRTGVILEDYVARAGRF